MTKPFCTICLTIAIVGCLGRHVADDLRDENGHVEIHDARPVHGLEDSEEDSEADDISAVTSRNSPTATAHTLEVGAHLFRREAAFKADLGKYCDMKTFYECDFKGYIGGSKTATLSHFEVDTYPAFTMSANSDESSVFKAMLPEMLQSSSEDVATGELTIEGDISGIDDELQIMETINNNPTLLTFLQKLSDPHVVTGIIRIVTFDDTTTFRRTDTKGADKKALAAAAKVGMAAATGGASAIPGAVGAQIFEGLATKQKAEKPRGSGHVVDRLLPGERMQPEEPPGEWTHARLSSLMEAPGPGAQDGIQRTNSASGKSAVSYGAGTIVGYEAKRIVFSTGMWASLGYKRVQQLERSAPKCEPYDMSCWAKEKLNRPSGSYLFGESK